MREAKMEREMSQPFGVYDLCLQAKAKKHLTHKNNYDIIFDVVNIGMSPSGKAPDFDSGTRRFKSGHPSQKRSNFCLPKVTSFFIHCESDGISSRFSVYIIAAGVYHQP